MLSALNFRSVSLDILKLWHSLPRHLRFQSMQISASVVELAILFRSLFLNYCSSSLKRCALFRHLNMVGNTMQYRSVKIREWMVCKSKSKMVVCPQKNFFAIAPFRTFEKAPLNRLLLLYTSVWFCRDYNFYQNRYISKLSWYK